VVLPKPAGAITITTGYMAASRRRRRRRGLETVVGFPEAEASNSVAI
jgi:hypothetical protein